MSSFAPGNITQLLKKTEHYDKDERYMATSDLCECLKQKRPGTTWETVMERQICTAVLRLLHDKSHDVQAIAVKTLSVLLTTVQEEQVLEIADSLADQVLDTSKTELRDVYAIGLRTLVKTVPASMGPAVGQRLVGRLLDEGVCLCGEEIALVCLEILTDILTRFGGTAPSVVRQHEAILNMCLKQLSASPALSKRAGNTLACLAVVLSDSLLTRMIEALLIQIPKDAKALLRVMCNVAGAVAHRLSPAHMDRILPLLLQFVPPSQAVTDGHTNSSDNDDGDDYMMSAGKNGSQDEAAVTQANELRESCFIGFESFLQKCPSLVEPHLQAIVQAALAWMSYDPNYSYGDDNDNMQQDNDEDDEDAFGDDEDDLDDDYEDDDDDESWKVRRSAIRTLRAVVEAKQHSPEMLWNTSYDVNGYALKIPQALLLRFKEREENCRVGVIDCFTDLLRVSIQATEGSLIHNKMTDDATIDVSTVSTPLVKACEVILNSKSNERSKSSVLALLAAPCQISGGVGSNLTSVLQHVQTFLSSTSDAPLHSQGTSKALRLDALTLVHVILASHRQDQSRVRAVLLESLLTKLCASVQEQWYKVIAEAVRAITYVPPVVVGASDVDCQRVANDLYDTMEPLLASPDVDQEIKECALSACASLLTNLHTHLGKDKQSRLLGLLLDRLNNEVTRIPAIKTLVSIASADLQQQQQSPVDLSPILSDSLASLASFLKLQSRSTKQSALEALKVLLLLQQQDDTDTSLYASVLADLAPLIGDADLHLCHLSLGVASSILEVSPSSSAAIKVHVLKQALILSTSLLLQDVALESLLALFQQMVVCKAVDVNELLNLLQQRLTSGVGKHGVYNLAKCIATVTSAAGTEHTQIVLNDLVAEKLENPNAVDVRQIQLSLLVTGYIGRSTDLSQYGESAAKLKDICLRYFDSSSEDLKQAAACALGNASVGSQANFLPTIVSRLDKDKKKQQYLLLSALREFIQSSHRTSGSTPIYDSLSTIVPSLEAHYADSEESVRTMVAECMGSLAVLQPSTILKRLAEIQSNHMTIKAINGVIDENDEKSKNNALVCWTIANSVKLAVAGKVDSSVLSIYVSTFVQLLNCEEIHVLNAALLMVYSIVHHASQVIAGLFQESITPALFRVSELKLERKVDLGPFTHTVDDALPLRKAALSIFASSLDNLPGTVDVASFLPVLSKAMGDAEDIQLHAYQIVIAMCTKQPKYLVNSIDNFVDPLDKTIRKKTAGKSGTELDRLQDWIKSAVRVMLTLERLEGSSTSTKFADFVERVRAEGKVSAMIESLAAEN